MASKVTCPDCDITHPHEKCVPTLREIMQDVWPRNTWSLGMREELKVREELKDRFYKWLKGCNYKQGGLAASSALVSELKRIGFSVEVGEEDEF